MNEYNPMEIPQRALLKCVDFARQLSYHRAFMDFKDNFHHNFWRYMFNNTIDLAVVDWCCLFGDFYKCDDLYWKNVCKEKKESFKTELLKVLAIDEEAWGKEKNKIREYRGTSVAHIRVQERYNVPDMEIALKAVCFYYHWIRKNFIFPLPNSPDRYPDDLYQYYQKSFIQSKRIVSVAYRATQSIQEEVF